MPLVKRKPVIYAPLPSLSTVLQPITSSGNDAEHSPPPSPAASGSASASASVPHPSVKLKGKAHAAEVNGSSETDWKPPDSTNDEEQLERLATVFRSDIVNGTIVPGRRPGQMIASGSLNLPGVAKETNGVNGHSEDVVSHQAPETWKITDREVFYIPETGEIFTDYEAYAARRSFYLQPLFQCEVTGKSAMTYFGAQINEYKEVRQLHTRFPRPLKKAVLMAVQFQIEGKLDVLADKIFERFVNRFFDDEKVFVDVQGDKYLARIVKTFPPRTLASSPLKTTIKPSLTSHPLATNLDLEMDEVNELDDPMKYFYSVRLIEEGATEAHMNGSATGGEQFEGSTMEVQADKISRDRINFSRAMLKRFIRDCVMRDPAVYSPWMVKPGVAARYGIPTEMPEEVRESISRYRERQMDKRKREREERLGITHDEPEVEEEKDKDKEKEKDKDKPKTKKQRQAEEKAAKEAIKVEEEELKKKKPMKFPAEDLIVEWQPERDIKDGRIEIRPTPSRSLPFGDRFEQFLMTWSFLNVMGKPLALSPFTLDDFEQSIYHKDPYTSPAPLMTEIHAALINALIRDIPVNPEAIKSIVTRKADENDADYWEGAKGATTETLRPAASGLAETWASRELSAKEGRRGWEAALVGCLWQRATLETLPSYLDNILHLLFEDKPAPTRPTWSTGPTTTLANGLMPSKPEKRWPTLHHTHKLDILVWLIESVGQTVAVRDFMEESTAALTEVRKEQVDVKREWRRIQAERDALEPKKEQTDAEGDVSMKEERRSLSPSINGHTASHTERDELDIASQLDDSEMASDAPASSPPASDKGHAATGAARRQAMAQKAAERSEAEAVRNQRAKEEREEARAKKAEGKQISAERKRLLDEEEAAIKRLHELEHEFRSHMYTLRARPFGLDRFGNKIWWMDGLGSASLIGENGKVQYGTGRVYVQGVEEGDVIWLVQHAEVELPEFEERRAKEEGEGRLPPGEWGVYDTPEQLHAFMSWLNPRGNRDSQLLKHLKQWLPEIEGGMKRRRIIMGLDVEEVSNGAGGNGVGDAGRRSRPVRKVAGGVGEEEGFLGWRNKRAVG